MSYIITDDNKKRLITYMEPYTIQACNCPPNMTVDDCPLRKELTKLQTEYDIGYRVLPNGTLSFPRFHYNEIKDKYLDIIQITNDICYACFKNYRQKD